MRTTVVTGVELDATGADLGNLPITITLESSSDLPLVFKNAANGADPDNKKLLNAGQDLTLTTDLTGLWSTPLVAPGDIAGLDSGGSYVAVTAWYSITRGVVTTTTTSFAYSATPLAVATLSASAAFPGITTAAMTLDVGTVGAVADPGEIVTVRVSQDCTAVCDDALSTVALYASTPYTATTDSNGHAVLHLVPSSRLPVGVFYWASLHIGSAQYSFAVPDGGGSLFANLVTPLTTGQTTVLAPNVRDRGVWDGAATYQTHDLVRRQSQAYLALSGASAGVDPVSTPATWLRLGVTAGGETLSSITLDNMTPPTGVTVTILAGTTPGSYLADGTTYYYAVSAFDANDFESPPSAIVAVTLPTPATQVRIDWHEVPGTASYSIYKGTTNSVSALHALWSGLPSLPSRIDTGNTHTFSETPSVTGGQGVLTARGVQSSGDLQGSTLSISGAATVGANINAGGKVISDGVIAQGTSTFQAQVSLLDVLYTVGYVATYAATVALPSGYASNVVKVTTTAGVGNATITLPDGGIDGQLLYVVVANDASAARTITFGTHFQSTGPLVGTPSKTAVVTFLSNSTAFWEVSRSTGIASDATTSTAGVVELRTAASGAHPVALTTDDLAAASGVASLDASSHGVQQPTRDATEAATNDTLSSSSSIINNLNRIRYQLAQLGTGAWTSLRAMVQLSPSGQQTGAINVSGEVLAADFAPGGLTGATAASRYVGGTASGAPASGTFLLGDWVLDQTGKIWVCTTAGTPGTWTQLAGGSGSATLAGDSDVSLGSPAEADRLRYSASDSKWHNTAKVWQPLTNGSSSSPEIIFTAAGDVIMAEA